MSQWNVDTTLIKEVDGPTGSAIIFNDPTGENSIVVIPGANAEFTEIPDAWYKVVREADVVLMQREIPEWVNETIAKEAKFSILDCGGDAVTKISHSLLSHCSIVSPNETELESLAGKSNMDDKELEQLVKTEGFPSLLLK